VVLVEALYAADPTSLSLQKDLGRAQGILGRGRLQIGTFKTAEQALERAFQVFQKLAHDNPSVPEYRYGLGEAGLSLGIIYEAQGRTALAKRVWEEGLANDRQLLHISPNHNDARITVEQYESALGSLDAELGRMQSALRWDDNAMAALSDMQRRAPDDVALSDVVSEARIASLRLDVKVGRSTGADRIAAIRRDIDRKRELAESDLRNVVARSMCVNGLLALAERSQASDRPADALAILTEASAVLAPGVRAAPNLMRFRALEVELETSRGEILRQLGKAGAAKEAARQAVAVAERLAAVDPAYHFALACAYSLQFRLDPTAPDPPAAAVKALREAVEAGYDNVYKLEIDHRLKLLHGREDFKELMRAMREKPLPGPPQTEVRDR
jgi:tetratricopeptide (TPR) repeat protein